MVHLRSCNGRLSFWVSEGSSQAPNVFNVKSLHYKLVDLQGFHLHVGQGAHFNGYSLNIDH